MKSFHYDTKRFKNGNLSVRFSPDEIKDIKESAHLDEIELLGCKLDAVDTYFISDEYCLSNYEMGCTLYNCHDDRMYILNFSDIENVLMKGKTLKLYALEPTVDDREVIERDAC